MKRIFLLMLLAWSGVAAPIKYVGTFVGDGALTTNLAISGFGTSNSPSIYPGFSQVYATQFTPLSTNIPSGFVTERDPVVCYFNGAFRCYYGAFTNSATTHGSIGMLYSVDGTNWTDAGIVIGQTNSFNFRGHDTLTNVIDPAPFAEGGTLYMGTKINTSGGLSGPLDLWTSTNGTNFAEQGIIFTPTGSGVETAPYGYRFAKQGSTYVLLFNEGTTTPLNKVGRATAPAITGPWTRDSGNPIYDASGDVRVAGIEAPTPLKLSDNLWLIAFDNLHSQGGSELVNYFWTTNLLTAPWHMESFGLDYSYTNGGFGDYSMVLMTNGNVLAVGQGEKSGTFSAKLQSRILKPTWLTHNDPHSRVSLAAAAGNYVRLIDIPSAQGSGLNVADSIYVSANFIGNDTGTASLDFFLGLTGFTDSDGGSSDGPINLVGLNYVDDNPNIGSWSISSVRVGSDSQGTHVDALISGSGLTTLDVELSVRARNTTLLTQQPRLGPNTIELTNATWNCLNPANKQIWVHDGTAAQQVVWGTGVLKDGSGLTNVTIASTRSIAAASTGITFPNSTVTWTNTNAFNIVLYINNSGVTVTSISKNGQQIFGSLANDTTLALKPGDYFAEAYTGSPSARWEPQ